MKKKIKPKLNMSKRYNRSPAWDPVGGKVWSSLGVHEVKHERASVRRERILDHIRQREYVVVNREGFPKTYHGAFGRDVRKLLKLGVIERVKVGQITKLIMKKTK